MIIIIIIIIKGCKVDFLKHIFVFIVSVDRLVV